MPTLRYKLSSLLRTALRGWRLPLAVALFVFLTSRGAMALVEPADNAITRPENFWWYFVATAATVGYGDFFPTTVLGRFVGSYVIVGGIVALTVLFTRLATSLSAAKGRRLKGVVELDERDHKSYQLPGVVHNRPA